MNFRHIGLSICLILGGQAVAQNPKWFKKAQKAQLSIVTFDADNQIIGSGNGFIIDEQGTALSNYQLFKGAAHAKVVDGNGKEYTVKCISGANSLYDVVKFQLDTDRKLPALTLAEDTGTVGQLVYILPYSTQKDKKCVQDTLSEVSTFDEGKYGYYAIPVAQDVMKVNVPVMNEEGEVMGMVQTSTQKDKTYALSARYGADLKITSLSATDGDLNAIRIWKQLPTELQEAVTFLFLASGKDSVEYEGYIQDFIQTFPKDFNGYTTAISFYTQHGNFQAAENAANLGLEEADEKDQIHYALSQAIYSLNLTPNYQLYKDWNLEKALNEADQAYQNTPLPIYLLQKGHCFYALKQYQEACNAYMEVNKTNMKSPENFLFAAQCKKMMNAAPEEILALQDSAVNMHTQPYKRAASSALLARAQTLIDLKDYRKAIVDLNHYESLNMGNLNANFYYIRSQAALNGNMYELAVNDISKATRLEPDNATLFAYKASIHYRVGLIDEAIEAARQSVTLDPEYADAHRILGVCLIQKGDKEAGKASLQKAMEYGDQLAPELLENVK